jgi:hypothetical protein
MQPGSFAMRGIVMLLLGGGLLWWIWTSVDRSEAKAPADGSSTEVTLGRMLAPAEAGPPEGGAPIELEPKEDEQLAPDDLAGRPVASGIEDPVALAACLLHRPQDLEGDLVVLGVSEARRRLVLALAHAIAGRQGLAASLAEGLGGSPEILSSESDLLERLLAADSAESGAVAATVSRATPLLRAATMAWAARNAGSALNAGELVDAARIYSDLLLEEIHAPWPADTATLHSWSEGLRRAQAGHRWDRDGPWPSVDAVVQPGDSLVAIRQRVLAERPDLLLCTGLIARANGLNGAVIHPGDRLRVPTDRPHMLVDLDARWAFYLHGEEVVAAWQVGVGRPGSETRIGVFTVGEKKEEPMWFRQGQAPIPYGHADNPLGTRWIGWIGQDGRSSSFGFHGTSEPSGIGQAVSDGCIRMHNRDVEELFEVLPRDATVVVQP